MKTQREQNKEMLETAKRSISELDVHILRLTDQRDVWMKICGKIEGELYNRILPKGNVIVEK